MSSKTIGDRKGGAPEGGPKRNDDHRNQDKDDGFTKRDRLSGDLMNMRIPAAAETHLHGIESLAVQCIERRPMRLLRGRK